MKHLRLIVLSFFYKISQELLCCSIMKKNNSGKESVFSTYCQTLLSLDSPGSYWRKGVHVLPETNRQKKGNKIVRNENVRNKAKKTEKGTSVEELAKLNESKTQHREWRMKMT